MRDAIEEYRRALDRCPTFHDIRYRLGITLREAGLPFKAVQEFGRILRINSGMLDSRIQLGLTYYSMGRTPEAIQEWEAVLETEPSRDEERMYLRLVRGAQERESLASTSTLSTDRGAPKPHSTSAHGLDAQEQQEDDFEISAWSTTPLTKRRGESDE